MNTELSGTSGSIFTNFSPIFHGLVELCKGLINFAFTWQSLKGRWQLAMATYERPKIGVFHFLMLPYQNRLEYWKSHGIFGEVRCSNSRESIFI